MGHSQNKAKKGDKITSFVKEVSQLKDVLKIPGLSLVIIKNQKVVYSTGIGLADIEQKIPATKNTLYSIASLTKTFTSAILMKLAEEGKVNLNDAMSIYDLGIKNDSLKVFHFLTHTSEEIPGNQYKYNGDRYALLQKVIEKATGKSFQEVIEESILSKLKMKESVAGQDILEREQRYTSLKGKLAKPYTLYGNNEMILSPYPPKKITAAAGLLSNVIDMAKYDIAIDRHNLISKSSQQKAWQNFILNDGTPSPYGYGWFIQNYEGSKIVWHYGQWPAYSSLYIKVPEQELSLIILANSDGLSKPFSLGGGNLLNSAFALAFLKNFIGQDEIKSELSWSSDSAIFYSSIASLKSRNRNKSYVDEENAFNLINKYLISRVSRIRQIKVTNPQVYHEYTGVYELLPSPVIISELNNKLQAEGPLLNSKVDLFPESENKFFLKILNVQIEFIRDQKGNVNECNLFIDGNKYKCKKIG